jgi:class 3 adenylate cyclase
MKPWVVDAKDIEPEDLDQFSGQLLHLNNQIADFLDPATTEEVLVIAPKGFGKTLLLKAKRQSMRERYRAILPERALVDKPSANPDLMSHREYGSVRETEAYWKALWSIALTLAVEKHLGFCPELSGPLEKMVRNEHLRSACDLFTNLLALSRDAYFTAFKDYVTHLLPVFRRIHSSVAMFIDNIDEYFEDFLASDLIDTEEQRAIYRSYWHFAQVGIALAARDLHAINNHVKIFASIRKEVFQRTFLGNPLGLQLAGSALDLQYAREDLTEIIRKNIEVERKRSLVEPAAKDPWVRFFGHHATVLVHQSTGDEEHVGAFWIRHTFRRPRDIVFIGRDLAAIDPGRRTRESVRQQITRSAAAIAQGFITEMSPHLSQFDREILFRLIRRNVIPRAELQVLGEQYDRLFAAKQGSSEPFACHVFASMFKIGLLGYVGIHPETAELVQYFRHPGEVPLDRDDVLPDAELFLVHPSLDLLIGSYNPDYFRNLDKLNVIGADRPWRPTRQTLFVLKGDVRGAGGIFQDPVAGTTFPSFFAEAVAESGRDLVIAQATNGDSALLIDPNPRQVVIAALALRQRLRRSAYGCEMRFGGDAGFVEIAGEGRSAQARAGLALLVAARLEPHAAEGTILVTGQFVEAWRDLLGVGGLRARAVEPHEVPKLRESDGRFDLAKPDGEAPMLRRLRLLDGPGSVGDAARSSRRASSTTTSWRSFG